MDAGPGTETTVTLSVASTATLDLVASSGAVESPDAPMQEITVEGKRLNEVRTSEVGTTVSQHQIETVPQITRNFLEFADTVPGVVFEVDGSGRTKISSGAQNRNGVNLYIDGVGQKGYVRSGVSGRRATRRATRSRSSPSVNTRSSPRTTRRNTTRSRARRSPRSPLGYQRIPAAKHSARTPRTTTAQARRPNSMRPKAESESKEYGIAFGGPIIEDRLHFFLTYEGKRFVTPVSVLTASAPADVVAHLPPERSRNSGPRKSISRRTCSSRNSTGR